MLNKAIDKLKAEMKANAKNTYVQVVGSFLIAHLHTNNDAEEKVLAKDKTILKSLEAMRAEASKRKVGNCAVLTDAEGFGVVLKYFGIKAPKALEYTPAPVAAPKPVSGVDFDIDLDTLLG